MRYEVLTKDVGCAIPQAHTSAGITERGSTVREQLLGGKRGDVQLAQTTAHVPPHDRRERLQPIGMVGAYIEPAVGGMASVGLQQITGDRRPRSPQGRANLLCSSGLRMERGTAHKSTGLVRGP